MRRVAIVNFTGFRGNWGCQATSFELLKWIAGLFPAGEPLKIDCVPLLPTSHVDVAYDAKLDAVFESFTAVARQTDRSASALAFLTEACVLRYGFWAEIVRRADLVVFQAEGSMGLGTGFARGPRLMLLPFVAKHAWGRRVISLNQSFYSHDERIVQNAAETFGTLDFSAFREGASVAFARASGVTGAACVPDLAFLTGADWPAAGGGEPKRRFAVSGSALKDPARYRLIREQSRAIVAATGLRPLLAVSRDVKLSLQFLLHMPFGGYDRIPRSSTHVAVAAELADCALLLGGRYHMAIMAAAVGTPSLFLPGNSFKNDGLAHLLQAPRNVRAFDDTAGILTDCKEMLADLSGERQRLQARVARIRGVIARAADHVRDLMDGGTPGPFEDGLEPFPFSADLLDRYRKFGRGTSGKRSRALPGARLGSPNRPQDLLPSLLADARAGSASAADVIARICAADPASAAFVAARGATIR